MSVDWEEIRSRLPTDRSAEQKQKRLDLFRQFDVNSNGYLSLAEVDKGIRDVLNLDTLFETKPVIMRAFTTARTVSDKKDAAGGSKANEDYVEYSEFRLLLVYLKHYLEIWEMFEMVSDDGDRRIDFDEFQKALSKLESWGHGPIDNAQEEFQSIDKNGGGYILFEEFAAWILSKHLHLEKDFHDDDA